MRRLNQALESLSGVTYTDRRKLVTMYRQKPFCFSSAARIITSELANQRARQVLFTCVVIRDMHAPAPNPTKLLLWFPSSGSTSLTVKLSEAYPSRLH